MPKQYHFFYLEMALKDKTDSNIYAFVNVSHIPTKKLIEIFNINQKKDPHLVNGHLLTKTSYRKHRKYFTEHIGPMNLFFFEYTLMHYASSDKKSIRKLYKEDAME